MKRRDFLAFAALSPMVAEAMINSKDIYLSKQDFATLQSLNKRLKRLRSFVGYAHFNYLSFDSALYYGRNYSKVGAFSAQEIALMERFFYEDPKQYGFYGERTCDKLTNIIAKKEIIKVPYTGHYLFKGKPLEDYERLKKDIGDTLVLTSGIRNTIKQISLYARKIEYCQGNITQASISLAPPGFSYHTISDFDVGRKGWGYKNFTASFAKTQEFEKLKNLDYIGIRYTHNNLDGVRFEPWHVEII